MVFFMAALWDSKFVLVWILKVRVPFKTYDNHGVGTDEYENALSITVCIANDFSKGPETCKSIEEM